MCNLERTSKTVKKSLPTLWAFSLFCRPRCPRAGSILPRSYSTVLYLGQCTRYLPVPTGSAVFEQGTAGSPERALAHLERKGLRKGGDDSRYVLSFN